jgi:hypothetical protein
MPYKCYAAQPTDSLDLFASSVVWGRDSQVVTNWRLKGPLMEWSGRALALPTRVQRSTAMSNKSDPTVATMGIDIGKNSFHVVGLDQRGTIVLRQKWSRGQVDLLS